MHHLWTRLTAAVTTRRGAWATLGTALLLTLGAAAALGSAAAPGAVGSLPSSSESAAAARLEQQLPGHRLSPVVAVFTRTDGVPLGRAGVAASTSVGRRVASSAGQQAGPTAVSQDGRAAIVAVPVDSERPNSEIAGTVASLRDVARASAPPGVAVQITGGPAFGADIAAAFDGADTTLLAVTVGVVALLLLLTYRSPVLWLVPLTVVGVADSVAGRVTAAMGQACGLQFDAGVISVLVFGAGTNYALLLVSRYREELQREESHRAALRTALRASAGAMVASNLTVVLSLLTLVAAAVPSTRGLGVAAAAGLLVALAFALLVLPAALALVGRGVFWPFVPRPGDHAGVRGGLWHRVATAVSARPRAVVAVSLAVVALLASGLVRTRIGLTQTEQFRVASESARGLDVLARHFPAGESQPLTVVARTAAAAAVEEAVTTVPGVVRATATATSASGLTRLAVVAGAAPGSEQSRDVVRAARAAVHAVPGAGAVVGGPSAEDLDVRTASSRDLRLVAPLVLAVVLVILVGLLRALVAPVVLTIANAGSALAAIGAGTWVGTHLLGFPALDVNVPLLAFLFLVALGIDYTIFLVHRARAEARAHGTVEGMVRAVSHTGAVITSAGVVLAAVFAALGVLPLVTLGQLGLIVGLGVLVDTLLVRTVLVPALFALLGDRMWWPSPAVLPLAAAEGAPVLARV